jgi:hypothetical protein
MADMLESPQQCQDVPRMRSCISATLPKACLAWWCELDSHPGHVLCCESTQGGGWHSYRARNAWLGTGEGSRHPQVTTESEATNRLVTPKCSRLLFQGTLPTS